MKKIIILLCVMFVLVGCNKEKEKDNDVIDTQTSPTDVQPNPTDKDSDTNEVIEIPSVASIAKKLNMSKKDMNIIEQKKDHLLFCFFSDDFSSSSIIGNHVKELEKDGYQMTLYDGTISSTFVLKKGNQTISITYISALDEWKEVHKDEMNVNAIKDNENCVYEIVNQ